MIHLVYKVLAEREREREPFKVRYNYELLISLQAGDITHHAGTENVRISDGLISRVTCRAVITSLGNISVLSLQAMRSLASPGRL